MGTQLALAAGVHPRAPHGVLPRRHAPGCAPLLRAGLGSRAGAQTAGASEADNDLAIFSALPEVVSASHLHTGLTMSCAPASVRTGGEIMAGVLDACASLPAAVRNSGSPVADQTPGWTLVARGEWGC